MKSSSKLDKFFFDVKTGKNFEYDELFEFLNKESSVTINFRTADTLDFFKNLLLGIVNDLPIIVFDLDFSIEEVESFLGHKYNPQIRIIPTDTKIITDLNFSEIILNSKTKISLFTSGTTGIPKLVEHTIASLTREIRIGEEYEKDIWAFAYNPTHIAGIQLFFQAVLNFNPIINIFSLGKSEILDVFNRFNPTNISATPSFYRLLLPCDLPLKSFKKVTLGGEKSDQKLINSLRNLFPNSKVYNIYATTEFGTILSSTGDYFKINAKYKDIVRVINGRLEVHKSLLGESNHVCLKDDWYETGDIVEFKQNSNTEFILKGRSSELINIGGNKVNPIEVEAEILNQFSEVKECLVYGRSNSVLGTIVCAKLVLHKNQFLTENHIKSRLNQKLQSFKVPRIISFVSFLEKNRAGKIKRYQ